MNREAIKAINKAEKEHPIKDWWENNCYDIARIIFFPIWFPMWLMLLVSKKYEKWANKRQKWSNERANKILAYYIPRKADWDKEDKVFYFFDNGMEWNNSAMKYLKFKDRRWWKKYSRCWGGEIREYLIEEFELEGFKKEVGYTDDGDTDITFTLIENE